MKVYPCSPSITSAHAVYNANAPHNRPTPPPILVITLDSVNSAIESNRKVNVNDKNINFKVTWPCFKVAKVIKPVKTAQNNKYTPVDLDTDPSASRTCGPHKSVANDSQKAPYEQNAVPLKVFPFLISNVPAINWPIPP